MKHRIILLAIFSIAITNLVYAENISYRDINMDSPFGLTDGDSISITIDPMTCGDTMATLRLIIPDSVLHYSWVNVRTDTFIVILQDTNVCVVTDTGTYQVQYDSVQSRVSNKITVSFYDPVYSGRLISNDTNLCVGASLTITLDSTSGGDSSYSYTWQQRENGNITTLPLNDGVSYTLDSVEATAEYRVIINSSQGCYGADTTDWLEIVVQPNMMSPAVLRVDSIFCTDTIATIKIIAPPILTCDSTVAFIYKWQRKEGDQWINFDTISTDSVRVTDSGYYRLLSIMDAAPLTYAISDSVYVQLAENIDAGTLTMNTPDTICYNQQITISFLDQPRGGVGDYVYTWYKKENGIRSIVGNDTNADTLSVVLNQSAEFMVVVSDNCSHQDSTSWFSVFVLPELVPAQIYLTEGDDTICYNTLPPDIAIDTNNNAYGGMPPYEYMWQYSTDSVYNDTITPETHIFHPAAITTTTNYRLKTVDSRNCNQDYAYSNIITIHVTDSLSPASITADDTVCYQSSAVVTIVDAPTGGKSQIVNQWQQYNEINNEWDDINYYGDTYTTDSLTSEAMFRLKSYDTLCSDTVYSNIVVVNIFETMTAPVIVSDSYHVCSYQENQALLSIQSKPRGAGNSFVYSWEYWNAGEWVFLAADTDSVLIPPVTHDSTLFRIMAQSVQCGDIKHDTIMITTYPQPNPLIVEGDTFTCRFIELPYLIRNKDSIDSTYTWFVEGGEIISGENSDTLFVRWTDTTGTYGHLTMVRESDYGCLDTTYVEVKFRNIPEAPNIVRKGSSNILIISNYAQDVYYQWGKELNDSILWESGPNASDRYYEFDDINSGIYNYVALAQFGKKYSDDSCMVVAIWDGNTSVSPNSSKEMGMTIAPNPATQYFDIIMNHSFESEIAITIFNNMGQKVFTQNLDNYQEDTPIRIDHNLVSGVYTVSVQTANCVINKKVIVK